MPEIADWLNKLAEYNIEQVIAKLLYELTRNTGFVVNKSNLGACWTVDCCNYIERENNDECGLDNSRLSLTEKMQAIMRESFLKKEFEKIGLETLL